MIKKCSFCTSADSTSWVSSNRYGRILGNKVSDIRHEKQKEICERAARLLSEIGVTPTNSLSLYFGKYWLSAYLNKKKYAMYAGNQN